MSELILGKAKRLREDVKERLSKNADYKELLRLNQFISMYEGPRNPVARNGCTNAGEFAGTETICLLASLRLSCANLGDSWAHSGGLATWLLSPKRNRASPIFPKLPNSYFRALFCRLASVMATAIVHKPRCRRLDCLPPTDVLRGTFISLVTRTY